MNLFGRLIVCLAFAFSGSQAFSALEQQDLEIFDQMQEATMVEGSYKVLISHPIQRDLKGLPFEQAAEQEDFPLAQKKSDFRSGVYDGVGVDFCHSVTGDCLSQQDPATVGKRPSRGQVPYFFAESYATKLNELKMEASIQGREQPWSDDYWAIKYGILGHRFTTSPEGVSWSTALSYVLERKSHLQQILEIEDETLRARKINSLSPSEKYDLLIGDVTKDDFISWTNYLNGGSQYNAGMELNGLVGGYLTPNMWSQGQVYFDRYGEVESWMGICHGWATAAIHLPRPEKAVEALAFDGKTKVTFYPSDIKSLGSLLWAQSAPRSRFIGGRCNDKEAEVDPVSGALVTEECFDTNPGDWHIIVANYLGELKKSFIMDATFDYAVWNQPVLSYAHLFVNPMTQERHEDFNEAIVTWDEYKDQDPFRNVREQDKKRKYIVGVLMRVDYLVETKPTQSSRDDWRSDLTKKAYYLYDLELDKDLNIIGGEWHQNDHPDFLWNHDEGQKAIGRVEKTYASQIEQLVVANYGTDQVRFDRSVSPQLGQYFQVAGQYGEVSSYIVEALFREASQ